MKIMILANAGIGLYKFRKELIEALTEKEHEVYIAYPMDSYKKKFTEMGCNVIDTPLQRRGMNPFQDIKLLIQYNKIIKKISPDIIFTYTIKPNIYGGIAAQLRKVPYVSNITGLGSAVEKEGLLQKITLNLYRIAFKNVKTVFFQNTENRQLFRDNEIAPAKHKMLPGSGVNLEAFKYLNYPNNDTIDFVFISRIMKEKGIDLYLETARRVRAEYPNTQFHICGFCEEEYEEILKREELEGNIIYHGLVENIQDVLKDSNCTIHPTYYPEGLSNVLLESAASGRPIITTNRSGCREVINEKESINGYLVEQNNQSDLLEKVRLFLSLTNEEMKEMGINGRKKVTKEFDRNIIISKYLSELEDIG